MANHPADDWKFWLVVNPAKWLVPIFLALLGVAVLIHVVAFSNPHFNIFAGPPAKAVVAK